MAVAGAVSGPARSSSSLSSGGRDGLLTLPRQQTGFWSRQTQPGSVGLSTVTSTPGKSRHGLQHQGKLISSFGIKSPRATEARGVGGQRLAGRHALDTPLLFSHGPIQ